MVSPEHNSPRQTSEDVKPSTLKIEKTELFHSLIPARVDEMNNLVKEALIFSIPSPQDEVYNRYIKRVLDIVFSLFILLFVFSWLCPLIAVLIKLESKGPVIFRQLRSGKNNESFWCYKFRSMRINEDSHHRQASRNDERITRLGNFLRKTSLDEFPQFINVLLGSMSVVGPRPHMVKHTEQYRYTIDNYMLRHSLKPGITGWAQINGYRGETKELDAMQQRIHHDIWYLQNWSVRLDIRIIFFTTVQVLTGHKNAF